MLLYSGEGEAIDKSHDFDGFLGPHHVENCFDDIEQLQESPSLHGPTFWAKFSEPRVGPFGEEF